MSSCMTLDHHERILFCQCHSPITAGKKNGELKSKSYALHNKGNLIYIVKGETEYVIVLLELTQIIKNTVISLSNISYICRRKILKSNFLVSRSQNPILWMNILIFLNTKKLYVSSMRKSTDTQNEGKLNK